MKQVSVKMEEVVEIPNWSNAYPEHKFAVYKACFLSDSPNSHEIPITKEVLKKCASTILGNFLVAKIEGADATSHKADESIMGFFPKEQEVEFVEVNGVTKAYAYAVVSKRYAEQLNGIFEFDNLRNSSVEMTVQFTDETEQVVEALDIFGLCVLGKAVKGSCPDADIQMIRFAEKEAEEYFSRVEEAKIQEREEGEQQMQDNENVVSEVQMESEDKAEAEVKVEMEEAQEAEATEETEMEEVKEEETETVEEEVEASCNETEEEKMSEEEMLAKIESLETCVEEKENIIMSKDGEIAQMSAELSELRAFRANVEEKEKDVAVEQVLSEMANFMDKDSIDQFREEAKNLAFAELDGWSNKVKAVAFSNVVKNPQNTDGIFTFSAPKETTPKKSDNVWDRLN